MAGDERTPARPALAQAISCARRGDRPTDGSDIKPLRLEPILVWVRRNEAGLAKVNGRWVEHPAGEAWWPKIRQFNKGGQRYCPVEVKDYRWERLTVREKYEGWWRGPCRLTWHFQGAPEQLRRWTVVGVGVPEPDWMVRRRARKRLDKFEGD